MRELESLLPMLEPPPGGLHRLRQRIATPRRPDVQRLLVATAAVAAACLAVALVLPPHLLQRVRHDALTQRLQQILQPAPIQGVQVKDGAALALPSGQANVRLYLVVTAAPTAEATAY